MIYKISEFDDDFELKMGDFPPDQDSEFLVRERARGTKPENAYKSRKGTVVKEKPHTSLKERNKLNTTTHSNRNIH